MAKSKAVAVVAASAPEPDERTVAAMARAKERVLARRKQAAVKVTNVKGSIVDIGPPHADNLGQYYHLLDTFGTASNDFMAVSVSQVIEAFRDVSGPPNELAINAALAAVGGLQPDDELEAMLASQMVATHALAMTLIGRTRRSELLKQVEAHGGLAVKLMRSFTLQAEALAKLKRGGGQTVRVEHVHVHAGGQAVVGNVATGGGAPSKNEDQPHAKPVAALTHADAPFDPLRSTNAAREPVPVARHA